MTVFLVLGVCGAFISAHLLILVNYLIAVLIWMKYRGFLDSPIRENNSVLSDEYIKKYRVGNAHPMNIVW
jgi:hypothetical protein